MSAQHPSRSYRGCAMCSMHKRRGLRMARRDPKAVLRKLGKALRVNRGDLGSGW